MLDKKWFKANFMLQSFHDMVILVVCINDAAVKVRRLGAECVSLLDKHSY